MSLMGFRLPAQPATCHHGLTADASSHSRKAQVKSRQAIPVGIQVSALPESTIESPGAQLGAVSKASGNTHRDKVSRSSVARCSRHTCDQQR